MPTAHLCMLKPLRKEHSFAGVCVCVRVRLRVHARVRCVCVLSLLSTQLLIIITYFYYVVRIISILATFAFYSDNEHAKQQATVTNSIIICKQIAMCSVEND